MCILSMILVETDDKRINMNRVLETKDRTQIG